MDAGARAQAPARGAAILLLLALAQGCSHPPPPSELVVEDLDGKLAKVVRSALAGAPESVESLRITLERSACCFEPCPRYTITLRGDGSFRYEGHADVRVLGEQVGSVGSTVALELLRALESAQLLEGAPLQEMSFGPSLVTVSVSVHGLERRLMTYPGADAPDPASVQQREALWAIVSRIETATGARALIE